MKYDYVLVGVNAYGNDGWRPIKQCQCHFKEKNKPVTCVSGSGSSLCGYYAGNYVFESENKTDLLL